MLCFSWQAWQLAAASVKSTQKSKLKSEKSRSEVKLLYCVSVRMNSLEEIKTFSTEDVCNLISNKISEIDESFVSAFRKNKINGEVFLSLTDEEIAKEIRCTGIVSFCNLQTFCSHGLCYK